MDRWIRAYRDGGLSSLRPQPRSDQGLIRKFPEFLEEACQLRRELPVRSAEQISRILLARHGVHISPRTLRGVLRRRGLDRLRLTSERKVYGRFEAEPRNHRRVGDVLVGPFVPHPRREKSRRAYLFLLVDDYSRLLVYGRWMTEENTRAGQDVFRQAILRRGLPEVIYLDNGAPFANAAIERTCAVLGIRLVHSKPYSPQGRGKLERLNRFIRERFLAEAEHAGIESFGQLNDRFQAWAEYDCNTRLHAETKQTPIDRFLATGPPREVDLELLHDAFRWSDTRMVSRTAEVRLLGNHDGRIRRWSVAASSSATTPRTSAASTSGTTAGSGARPFTSSSLAMFTVRFRRHCRQHRLSRPESTTSAWSRRPTTKRPSAASPTATSSKRSSHHEPRPLGHAFLLHTHAFRQEHRRPRPLHSAGSRGGGRPHPLRIQESLLGVLTGEVGVGKTVALRAATAQLEPTAHQVIYVANPAFGTRGLYVTIVSALGATPRFFKAEVMAQAQTLLAAEEHERRRQVVLILDEAHLLSPAQLEEIRLLTNGEMDSVNPFALLLVGQPTLNRQLRLGVFAAQYISTRYHNLPMDSPNRLSTCATIRHYRCKDQLFADDAAVRTSSPAVYLRSQQRRHRRADRAAADGKAIVDDTCAKKAVAEFISKNDRYAVLIELAVPSSPNPAERCANSVAVNTPQPYPARPRP